MGFLSTLTRSGQPTRAEPTESRNSRRIRPRNTETTTVNSKSPAVAAPRRNGIGKKTKSLLQEEANAAKCGGVCISTRCLLSDLTPTPATSAASGLSSTCVISSDSSADGSEAPTRPLAVSWKSTDTKSFMQHMPLLVRNPENDSEAPIVDAEDELCKVISRARQLPGTWYYSSNHVMVNQARVKCTVAPVARLRELDEIARSHAAAMAEENSLFHMTPVHLQESFPRVARRFGVNIAKGESIRAIHESMMRNRADKNNILDRRYTNMGMGTAVGPDGELFLCQVFRG
jgi:Cysteine-rich secretory protein family